MRALVQRVSSAAVRVDGERIAAIGPGMLVLVGVGREDGPEQADRLAAKLSKLRIFADETGRIGEPLGDREVLCVSQFTLYGDTRRGNRPSFTAAADPEPAKRLYERLCDALGARRGEFGARMAVESINDGPLTLLVEVDPAPEVAAESAVAGP
jgi:D-aminoacyl-tRNA deacylase